MVAVTVTAPTVHRTTDTDMGAGIMATTMCMDVSSVVIKATAAWIDGNSHSKSHETSKPQGASIVPWGTFLPIRLQARVLGYSQRPSVTKDRLWLQVPDLVLKLYHSFPLFPSPFAIMDTMVAKGDSLLFLQYTLIRVIS